MSIYLVIGKVGLGIVVVNIVDITICLLIHECVCYICPKLGLVPAGSHVRTFQKIIVEDITRQNVEEAHLPIDLCVGVSSFACHRLR